jgi:DNA-binding transcriptional MerR regulator
MLDPGSNRELPPIPAKRYFTIGEVAELCDVKPHVLRYWETEFPTLKPVKRRGNRRYYQRADVLVIRQIRGLLYEEGYTIGGARLRIDTEKQVPAVGAKGKAATATAETVAVGIDVSLLRQVREELESVLALLRL